jgi:hypothetical protein
MKSMRSIPALVGGLLLIALPLASSGMSCGGSQQNPGVTNTQPETTKPPPRSQDQCLMHGAQCTLNEECCTEWCANGVCATRQP